MASGGTVRLGDLLRDPLDRSAHLACVALVLRSGAQTRVLPELSCPVRPGDQILFCGSAQAHRLLDATMNNEYTLRYLMTGRDEPRGWVMQWLTRKSAPPQGATPAAEA